VKGKKPPEQNVNSFNMQLGNETKAWEAERDLVLRQMLYDLTMWFSIRNNPKKTRYLSHNASEFIAAFVLDTDETPNGTIYSTDDEDGPGGPDADATNELQPQPGDMAPASSRNSLPARAGTFKRSVTPTGVRPPAKIIRRPSEKLPGNPNEIQRAFEDLPKQPADTATPPKKEEDKDESMTAEEVAALKRQVSSKRMYADGVQSETPRLPEPRSPRAK
jgi:hypothetical protein